VTCACRRYQRRLHFESIIFIREAWFEGGKAMHSWKALVISLGLGCLFFVVADAHAQTVIGSPSVALKNGETLELAHVYWVSHCKSILKATPEAEILDGPSGVSVAVKEAMVLPRLANCGNRVPGGTLMITAKDIDDQSYSKLTVRITFKTKDGDRKFSQVYNVSLFP
jgi:hypothetical protein